MAGFSPSPPQTKRGCGDGPDTALHLATHRHRSRGAARIGAGDQAGAGPVVSQTPLADRIEISYTAPEAEEAATEPVDDPWNFWTFRTSFGGFFNGESSFNSTSLSGTFSANRTTEEWKINSSLTTRYSQSEFEISEEQTVTNIQHHHGLSGLIVRSLGPHWSAGGRDSVTSSTFLNQEWAVRLAPAVEYNIYRYAESTRRQLTFQYSVGANAFNYEEETLFGETSETLLDQTLLSALSLRQPWDSISSSLEASQYLHDLEQYRLVFFNSLDVRLFKGFSLELFGSASLIRDQLFLPARGASPEEILLRQRQLATSYDYFASVGVSYTFGSIFNNVVNPRFSGASGGFVIFE